MRATIVAVLVGFVLALGAVALGAKWLGAPWSSPHTVAVTGEARLVGEPDTALVMFGVERSGKTVAEGQQRVSQLMSRIIGALQGAGVKKEDIATSELRISQGWDYKKKAPSGYTLSSQVTITVRNVQHVGRVVDTAVANGLNRLEGVSYDVRSPKWREKALREAVANAREKAEKIAAAAGRPLGQVVSVREQGEQQASPAEEYYRSGALSGETLPQTRSLPGQRAMTVQVEAVYEL